MNLQKRQNNQNSQNHQSQQNQQSQQKPALALKTAKGKEICGMVNDGKCAKQCQHKRLHICNFVKPDGKTCGSSAHARCDAH